MGALWGTRISEGLFADSSFHPGVSHTGAFHPSIFNTVEQAPQICGTYSEREQNDMIEYLKARMSWRQISHKMRRSQTSVKTHWSRVLKKDPRAKGVGYDPDDDGEIE